MSLTTRRYEDIFERIALEIASGRMTLKEVWVEVENGYCPRSVYNALKEHFQAERAKRNFTRLDV